MTNEQLFYLIAGFATILTAVYYWASRKAHNAQQQLLLAKDASIIALQEEVQQLRTPPRTNINPHLGGKGFYHL
ncbi:MAG: hypothetical protein AAF806_24760 [Bacteroidota bacterium]